MRRESSVALLIWPAHAVEGVPMEISASTMRHTLLAMAQTSGQQYELLLTRAGLSRFINALPAEAWQPVATSRELTTLFNTAYTLLGESLTRLFFRNFGQAMS